MRLHIERLILDGIKVDHPVRFGRVVERELAQRLREGGVSAEFRQGGATPYVAGGVVQFNEGQVAAGLGKQIAGAVYRGIGGRR